VRGFELPLPGANSRIAAKAARAARRPFCCFQTIHRTVCLRLRAPPQNPFITYCDSATDLVSLQQQELSPLGSENGQSRSDIRKKVPFCWALFLLLSSEDQTVLCRASNRSVWQKNTGHGDERPQPISIVIGTSEPMDMNRDGQRSALDCHPSNPLRSGSSVT